MEAKPSTPIHPIAEKRKKAPGMQTKAWCRVNRPIFDRGPYVSKLYKDRLLLSPTGV